MIEVLEDTAVEAGLEIIRQVSAGLTFETKADGSKRSNADLASEKIILARLRTAFSDILAISEEEIDDGSLPNGELPARYFLVDPLDGTRELEARNGQYAVNIALVEMGKPTLGVMFAPAENRIYATRAGRAITAIVSSDGLIGPADQIRCRPAHAASRGIVSRSRAADASAALEEMGISDIIQYGSTLKFCKVAEGYADVYVSKGHTREWDTAAGDAILQAAGGEVVSLDTGQPLIYGKIAGDKPLLQGNFVARSRTMPA